MKAEPDSCSAYSPYGTTRGLFWPTGSAPTHTQTYIHTDRTGVKSAQLGDGGGKDRWGSEDREAWIEEGMEGMDGMGRDGVGRDTWQRLGGHV